MCFRRISSSRGGRGRVKEDDLREVVLSLVDEQKYLDFKSELDEKYPLGFRDRNKLESGLYRE